MSLQRKKKSRTSVKKICFSTLSKSTPRVGVLGVCKGKCISSSIWTSHWVNHDAYDILDFFYLKKLNDLQYIIGQMQLYEFDTDITYSKSDPFFYSIHCYHFKKKIHYQWYATNIVSPSCYYRSFSFHPAERRFIEKQIEKMEMTLK